MPRALHNGRSAAKPFADAAVTAAQTATELALPETCRFGTLSESTDPDPPYTTTRTVVPIASGIGCLVEGHLDRPIDPGDDPSVQKFLDIRVPQGTAVAPDHHLEVTAGRNTGLIVRVAVVHDSTTEALLRLSCELIERGNG